MLTGAPGAFLLDEVGNGVMDLMFKTFSKAKYTRYNLVTCDL